MKKVLLILAILFMIFSPKTSFSQNEILQKEIYSIINELQSASSNLIQVRRDLIQIIKSLKSSRDYNYDLATLNWEKELLQYSDYAISAVETRCSYESKILLMFTLMKEEHKVKFCDFQIKELIKQKKGIMLNLEAIELCYPDIKNNAALYLIDKGKDIIRSSLKLFDKSIEVFQTVKIL